MLSYGRHIASSAGSASDSVQQVSEKLSQLTEAANFINQHYVGVEFDMLRQRVRGELIDLHRDISSLMQAAIQTGRAVEGASSNPALKIWAHWGAILLAGDPDLGSSTEFPRRFDHAPVTGFGYGESGGVLEDRWMEAWIGGTPRFDEAGAVVPSNVHSDQDPVPGLPQDPWSYQKFKDLAMRFGTYYVPDREGRLYRNGKMEPSLALTASEVFRSAAAGDDRGLIFVDTLDQNVHPEITAIELHSCISGSGGWNSSSFEQLAANFFRQITLVLHGIVEVDFL